MKSKSFNVQVTAVAMFLALLTTMSARAGSIYVVNLPPTNTDIATGITTNKTYVSAFDYGNYSTTTYSINGVPLTHWAASANNTYISITNVDPNYGGRVIFSSAKDVDRTDSTTTGSPANQASGNTLLMLYDLFYTGNSAPAGSALLQEYDNLTVGHPYSLCIYYRYFSSTAPYRNLNVFFNGEGFWQPYSGNPLIEDEGTNGVLPNGEICHGARMLEYDFTATATNVFCVMTNLTGNGAAMVYGSTLQDDSYPYAPFFTYQNQANPLTNAFMFSSSAIGTPPLSYQWYYNTVSNYAGATMSSNGDGVSGATSSNLTTTANLLDYYYVIVTNNYGSITSSIVQINPVPAIITQPVPVNVNNAYLQLNVQAGGLQPLAYQWYYNTVSNYTGATALSDGGGISGSATATLNTTQILDYYFVRITNTYGTVTSTIALFNPAPVLTAQFPITYTNLFTLYAGANPAFSVSVLGFGATNYFWFTNGALDAAATTNTLQLTDVQAGTFITNYCVVTNLYGSVTSLWKAQVIADPPNSNSTGIAPYPQAVLALSPVGYWRLNDTNLDGPDNGGGDFGYICDDYAGGNDGIYTNCNLGQPSYNPTLDPSDSSALFGEADQLGSDYGDSLAFGIAGINFGAPAGASAAFTVEAWANGYFQTYDAGIVTLGWGGGGEQFDIDTGANDPNHDFRFLVRDAAGNAHAVNSTIAPLYGNWYHLVGVVDEISNQDIAFYINGELAGTAALPSGSGILAATNLMGIGSRIGTLGTNYDDQFYGSVNDVAIFNYALSQNEVVNEYVINDIPPYFTQLAPAGINLNSGAPLSVSASANGTPPLSYQWFDENGQTNIAGQTNATLAINSVTGNDSYMLTVSNAYGSTNVTVAVTVNTGLNVSLGPPSLDVYTGFAITYTAQASGNVPFYYQWSMNGSPIANATNASYTAVATSGGASYTCTVSNGYDGLTITQAGPVTLLGGIVPPVAFGPTNLYLATVLSNNPVGFWRLNEGPDNGEGNDGTIAYDYCGNNNGVYTNVELDVSGFSMDNTDTAALFGFNNNVQESVNSCVLGAVNPDFSTPSGSNAEFTVEAWANSTQNNGLPAPTIVGKGNATVGQEYGLDAGGAFPIDDYRFLVYSANGDSYAANSTVSTSDTGQWYYLVGVCDEANGLVSLYINGALVASNAIPPDSGIFNVSTTPMTIGSREENESGSGYNEQFDGSISDVAIYNYAMSAAQIAANFRASQYVVPPGNLNPTNIVFGVTNKQLYLSWPADHTGWQLQVQTNRLSVGVSTNWVNVAGSTGTNQVAIPMNLTNGSVFYRLIYAP